MEPEIAPPHPRDELSRVEVLSVVVLAIVAAGSVAGLLIGRALGADAHSRILLLAASTAFVAIPLVAGGLRFAYGRRVLAGLVGCWFGDYLGQESHFLGSVGAFAVAHLLFLAAFGTRRIELRRLAVSVPVCAATSLGVAAWLLPHVSRDLVLPVVGYMVIITAMVAMAGGLAPGGGQRILLLAAVLFYVSDIFVARWKFVDPSPWNAFGCYPLYYAACLLFAVSVPVTRHRKTDGAP